MYTCTRIAIDAFLFKRGRGTTLSDALFYKIDFAACIDAHLFTIRLRHTATLQICKSPFRRSIATATAWLRHESCDRCSFTWASRPTRAKSRKWFAKSISTVSTSAPHCAAPQGERGAECQGGRCRGGPCTCSYYYCDAQACKTLDKFTMYVYMHVN